MIRKVFRTQYDKALSMLADAVESYADEIWYDAESYPFPAWRIAYHAILYTNIYCSATEEAIERWPEQRENYQILGKTPWPPHELIDAPRSYSRAQTLEFLEFVRDRVPAYLERIDPEAPCWPFWYDETQLEFHVNNLRHLQHHTGELIERHDIRTGFEYRWR